jgi:MFS family permease
VAPASLSDFAPPASRGTWLSTYSTAQGTGQALGPVVAGYLIAAGRFDLAFMAAGAIGLAAPLIVARWRDDSEPKANRLQWTDFRRGVAEVARDRLVLLAHVPGAGDGGS